jgi:hypothetical protein
LHHAADERLGHDSMAVATAASLFNASPATPIKKRHFKTGKRLAFRISRLTTERRIGRLLPSVTEHVDDGITPAANPVRKKTAAPGKLL